MARRHGKQTVVYVDGYDLSGDSNAIDVAATVDAPDTSAFLDNYKWSIIGQLDAKLDHKGWFNPDTARSHEVLTARIGGTVVLNAAYGQSLGDYGWGGAGMLDEGYTPVSDITNAVAITVPYKFSQYFDPTRVLFPKGALSTNGSALDGSAGSNNGGVGYLQAFAILGGTPLVTIEHSTTGTSAWATLLSFTARTTLGAERVEAAGTVRQYTRANVSGGSATAAVYFRRV